MTAASSIIGCASVAIVVWASIAARDRAVEAVLLVAIPHATRYNRLPWPEETTAIDCLWTRQMVARWTFFVICLHFFFMFEIYGPNDIFTARPSCHGELPIL